MLLRERVHGQLLTAILDGTLPPGHRLRDSDLIAWLGTSRAPIREALAQLADVGVVEMSPNRFTKVAVITPTVYIENAAVWASLIIRALHWGILAFPAERLPELEERLVDIGSAPPSDWPPGPSPIDRFLEVVLDQCDNEVLLDAIAVHLPLLQLGVNRFKTFLDATPVTAYFAHLIDRCAANDVVGLDDEMLAFLAGPMNGYINETAAAGSDDARPIETGRR